MNFSAVEEAAIASVELNHYLQAQAIAPELPTLVSVDIRVERIGATKRNNVPYIVYTTKHGRCCTFVSKAKFLQALRTLLGCKGCGHLDIVGQEVSEFGGLNFYTKDSKLYFPRPEVAAFFSRYNRVALERLHVEVTSRGATVHNLTKNTTATVTVSGCDCEDTLYNGNGICKHRIAAELWLSSQGWRSLQEYVDWTDVSAVEDAARQLEVAYDRMHHDVNSDEAIASIFAF